MGLDMYLNVRKYIRQIDFEKGYDQEDGYSQTEDFQKLIEVTGLEKLIEKGSGTGANVDVPVAQWRKANAIHKWFVDNRGDGEDNCQEIPCHLDHLEALVADCKKVIDNNDLAQEVLPTEGGFFFGETEYNEGYFSDIQYTHDRISEVIKLMRELDCDWATYQASW